MVVRYEAGDRSGALQAYKQFVKHLREELACRAHAGNGQPPYSVVRNARVPGDIWNAEDLQPAPESEDKKTQRPVLPFVGREAELEQLRGWWSRAARGRGGIVLIGGEAGIGKTRLAAELGSQAEREGARLLLGRTDFAEPVPYQALVEALRSALPLLQSPRSGSLVGGSPCFAYSRAGDATR